MTFIEISSASRVKLHASQRQTPARLCCAILQFECWLTNGSFINLASGGHLISRLFLEAQLQSASLKWGCWTAMSTEDMKSASGRVWGRRETVTKEIQGTKLCVVTQSCLCLFNICLFCLSEPPAHWHMNYTAWCDVSLCFIKYKLNGQLNLSIFLVGPAPSNQSWTSNLWCCRV